MAMPEKSELSLFDDQPIPLEVIEGAALRFLVLATFVFLVVVALPRCVPALKLPRHFSKASLRQLPVVLRDSIGRSRDLPRQVSAWACFLVLLVVGLLFGPPAEDTSWVITLCAGLELFAVALLAMQRSTVVRDGSGDSAEFAVCTAVAVVLRLACTLRFQGYLPDDESGDGCYQGLEMVIFVALAKLISQTGVSLAQAFRACACLAAAAAGSVVCYGDLILRPVWDRCYAASHYIEVLGVLFLCHAMTRAGRKRTAPAGALLPLLACWVLRVLFWYVAFDQMKPRTKPTPPLMPYVPYVLCAQAVLASACLAVSLLVVAYPPLAQVCACDALGSADPEQGGSGAAECRMARDASMVPTHCFLDEATLRIEYGQGNPATAPLIAV